MPRKPVHLAIEKLLGLDGSTSTKLIDLPSEVYGANHRKAFHDFPQSVLLSVISTIIDNPKSGKDI